MKPNFGQQTLVASPRRAKDKALLAAMEREIANEEEALGRGKSQKKNPAPVNQLIG